ncbi:hypothetical protein ALC57_18171 [Trachymyrmex cornetzi]|uniref:Uncharacterized protein n=1 Tax=Trachymyrmex cornetzi TaxID=471704 RepID=A0A195D9V6_9HYME|nr:hypothetical protein ALC57_18171 [Trachymyrmex cornetzi]
MNRATQESHDDPQFVKVLVTCLKMEIATIKESLDANIAEIKRLKIIIRSELNKRKELKGKMAQMNNIKLLLSDTLAKLHLSINETSDTLTIMKTNADDQYKLNQLMSQEYQDVVDKYKKTWQEYRAIYEDVPLAKARNASKINLEKLKINYMVMAYKKAEMMTVIKHRQRINWIRTRCKIIEFATMMLERLKLEEKFTKLKVNVKYHKKELQSIEAELQVFHKKEEEQKRQRKQEMLEMAPPKINILFRKTYGQNQMRVKVQHQVSQSVHESFDVICFSDISVNTLYLEELCINENAAVSPGRIDIEVIQDNDYTLPAVETDVSNSKNTIVSDNEHAVSVTLDAEPSTEKVILTDDVEMKEIHHEDKQKSQESFKTQPSFRTKENSLKHSAANNTQDEIEAKRIRLQRQESKESINKITTPRPSAIVKRMDRKSPLSVPKIKKIETVHYNITSLASVPKPIQRTSITASNQLSLYEGSLCNYKLSPTSNISKFIDDDAQMSSPPKYTAQQDKTDNETLSFQFGNFTKETKKDYSFF